MTAGGVSEQDSGIAVYRERLGQIGAGDNVKVCHGLRPPYVAEFLHRPTSLWVWPEFMTAADGWLEAQIGCSYAAGDVAVRVTSLSG